MSFCHARALHFVSDEVYALSTFASSSSSNSREEKPPIPFISALALENMPPAEVEEGDGTEALHEIDRSRVHVVWSTSKDFGSSSIRMVCPLRACLLPFQNKFLDARNSPYFMSVMTDRTHAADNSSKTGLPDLPSKRSPPHWHGAAK